jgi:hypothetical protein
MDDIRAGKMPTKLFLDVESICGASPPMSSRDAEINVASYRLGTIALAALPRGRGK